MNPIYFPLHIGAKMVVGMPFKDIATTDSIYLPEVPAVTDTASRKVRQLGNTRHNTTIRSPPPALLYIQSGHNFF